MIKYSLKEKEIAVNSARFNKSSIYQNVRILFCSKKTRLLDISKDSKQIGMNTYGKVSSPSW